MERQEFGELQWKTNGGFGGNANHRYKSGKLAVVPDDTNMVWKLLFHLNGSLRGDPVEVLTVSHVLLNMHLHSAT